jgi:hypothetical protein
MTWWLEPGDLQLLANHNVVHMRTRFEDHEVRAGWRGGGWGLGGGPDRRVEQRLFSALG